MYSNSVYDKWCLTQSLFLYVISGERHVEWLDLYVIHLRLICEKFEKMRKKTEECATLFNYIMIIKCSKFQY